jgi:hypothetical protein
MRCPKPKTIELPSQRSSGPCPCEVEYSAVRRLLISLNRLILTSMAKCSPALSGHRAAVLQSFVDSSALQRSIPAIYPARTLSVRPQGTGIQSRVVRWRSLRQRRSEFGGRRTAGRAERRRHSRHWPYTFVSHKRNVHFHEPFKTTSEGDCLIKGTSACGVRRCMNTYNFLDYCRAP